jgi:hypothetical protein
MLIIEKVLTISGQIRIRLKRTELVARLALNATCGYEYWASIPEYHFANREPQSPRSATLFFPAATQIS